YANADFASWPADSVARKGPPSLREVVHPDDLELAREGLARGLDANEGAPHEHLVRLRLTAGPWRWMSVRLLPVAAATADREACVQVVGVARDITEVRQLKEEQRIILRRRDEFVSILGHELRNPLSAIRTGLELLRGGVNEETRERIHAAMNRQVEQMVELLDDLLEVSRVSQGKVVLRRARFPVAEALARAIAVASKRFPGLPAKLSMDVPDGLAMVADQTRFEQILTEMLGNAGKFTADTGKIEVRAAIDDDWLEVRVKDDGIGISVEMQDTIFEPFVQVSEETYRHDGLGIGLARIRGLAELHGGRLWVESDGLGRGSEFIARLPLGEPTDARGDSARIPVLRHTPCHRVLVVEDKIDVAEGLAMVLERAGLEVQIAESGEDALARAPAWRPDAMVVDIGMPGMTGLELARRVRQLEELTGIVLIALSGFGHPQAKKDAAAAGFDRHMTKPANPQTLLRLLGVSSS
ncbi:MAG TPA: ATP-binding protein, partial [Kofleriaceae bacterium]|nr:ATP-binding protein [Kofleriaceae bacterium]